jgi:O-antigen/teichoic acid export membrane protein
VNLRKILKLLAGFVMSQGVNLAAQLIVPPLFLRRYAHGVEMYGEWVALTAAVSYLNSLNMGVQSYANNQMTLHYNRGEIEQTKIVQSSALRLILILVVLAIAVGGSFLFMPVARWMGLRYVSSTAASLTLFLMALQLIMNWFFSFLSNSYQVTGDLHRGLNWQNAQRLTAVLALGVFLWERASFPVLASVQLTSMVVYSAAVLIELRVRAPVLLPSLRYGNARDLVGVLKPSAYYGLFTASTFLAWQGPVLLIEKLLGPVAVAIFALSRTIFSMSRQLLMTLSYSIGQETITLIAKRSWSQLRRMYDLSERVVLLFAPVLTIGTLLMAPFLFSIWLHKRDLYDPGICMLMGAISAVMGLKEHKYVFQYLSNEHIGVAKFSLAAYLTMIAGSAVTLRFFGLSAFLLCWFVTELVITAYIVAQNQKLFPVEFRPSLTPLPRLAAVLVIGFASAAWPVWHDAAWPKLRLAAVAVSLVSGLGVLCYFAFGLSGVQAVFRSRLRRRFASAGG